jgi:hypothetical protein
VIVTRAAPAQPLLSALPEMTIAYGGRPAMHDSALGAAARAQLLKEILLGYLHAHRAFPWPGADSLTLEDAAHSYRDAVTLGRVPGPRELARSHPELGNELGAFFPDTLATEEQGCTELPS